MENTERKVWDIICKKLGINREQISVRYNLEFAISDLNSEIETLDSINTIADLPKYRAEKLKSIVKEDLKSSERETLSDIFEEIDSAAKISEVI